MQMFNQSCFRIFVKNSTPRLILNIFANKISKYKPILIFQCQILHSNKILRAKGNETDQNQGGEKGKEIEYYLKRIGELNNLNSTQVQYNKFSISHSLSNVIEIYGNLEAGVETPIIVTLTGRVRVTREMSKKLIFYDIVENGIKLQLVMRAQRYHNVAEFKSLAQFVKRGDHVGVKGYVMKTKSGELSLLVNEMKILAPRLACPAEKNDERLLKIRCIELMTNEECMEKFNKRAKIICHIKHFLKERNFLEVKTPYLTNTPSGAVANPFSTQDVEGRNLFFRIAPELYLKMLVVGGMPRVFEIGPQFRNEAIDRTHFPVFTTCEFYSAHTDYSDLFNMTEEMVGGLVFKLFGQYRILYDPADKSGKSYEINFEPPFERVDLWSALESKLGCDLPHPSALESTASEKIFTELCHRHGILVEEGCSVGKLIDKLCDLLLVSDFENPTFLINYPLVMSPLAKVHRDRPGLSERFELFAGHLELCNAYTELNDPCEQEARFRNKIAKVDGLVSDKDFLHALRHGLPPTAGWGMGIDRLVMLLTNCHNISQVILFPTLKPATTHLSMSESKAHNLQSQQKSHLLEHTLLDKKISCKEKMDTLPVTCKDYYYLNRLKEKEKLEKLGVNMYPHRFDATHSLADVLKDFATLKPGDVSQSLVSVRGRVGSTEMNDEKITSLFDNDAELQLLLNEKYYLNKEEFDTIVQFITRGDYLGVEGYVTKAESGKVSLQVTKIQVLAPCLVRLPTTVDDSAEQYVDLMLNKETRCRFDLVIGLKDWLRRFLTKNSFQEVDTPLLMDTSNVPAESFVTYLKDLKSTLCVCTKPEMFLVEALVGGWNQVFEMRTQFRNVFPDRIHYPEFSTCQFFATHADYRDGMHLTERMLRELVGELSESYTLAYNKSDESDYEIDFGSPFQKVDFWSALRTKLGKDLPEPTTLDSKYSKQFFIDTYRNSGINIEPNSSIYQLVRGLCDKLLVPDFVNPTYLINHPVGMSPYSVVHANQPALAERFELYAGGIELASGYSVLTDTRLLEARFHAEEATDNGVLRDEDYIHALRFGLPATAGVTLGLDRLSMLLANCQDVKQVILFTKTKFS